MKHKIVKLVLGVVILILILQTVFAATRVFQVQETDFVKINAKAIDPDLDKVTYQFGEPLDQDGEWQTTYGDAGEYEIDVKASDGKNETIKKIKLVVTKRNQAPYVKEKKLVAKESKTVNLKEAIVDPDGDVLTYTFKAPFNEKGVWQTNFNDAGEHTASFTVTDGEFLIEAKVNVVIEDKNQPPFIDNIFSEEDKLEFNEGEELNFSVKVRDIDSENIDYIWKLDGAKISEDNEGEHEFDYDSSGEHQLELQVSDGENNIERSWKIEIENTNRKPALSLEPITVNEGELVKLILPGKDQDGDSLTYELEKPLDSNGKWKTDFEDAGKYFAEVVADDGEYKSQTEVEINVVDVDRIPTLNVPTRLEVKEGEKLSWTIDTTDPDNDVLDIKVINAPEGSILNKKVFSWEPDFSAIKRKGGFVSNVLNSLNLERFFLKMKVIPLKIKVCGKSLCNNKELELVVYNVNRPPVMQGQKNYTIQETEELTIVPSAIDPDGDIVKYAFSSPVQKRSGKWKTSFDDEGIYDIYVSATDGRFTDTLPFVVNVKKKNRGPSLNVDKDEFVILEGKKLSFKVTASDPDEDNLNIELENLPPGASFKDETFIWTPSKEFVKNKSSGTINKILQKSSYLIKKFSDDEKTHWLKFSADDGETKTIHPVKVIVKNKNQAPKIIDYLPMNKTLFTEVNKPLIFHVTATDSDNDKLSYEWSFDFGQQKVRGTDTIERTFLTPGEKKVKVKVTDGLETVEKEWMVSVQEVLYPTPVIISNPTQNVPQALSPPETETFRVIVIE